MTPEQIRALATELIRGHACDIPFLTVTEAAEDSEHTSFSEISEDDARAVHDEIRRAVVTVTWPDQPPEYEWAVDWGDDDNGERIYQPADDEASARLVADRHARSVFGVVSRTVGPWVAS